MNNYAFYSWRVQKKDVHTNIKIVLTMKLIIFILIASLFKVNASVFAQKVNLSKYNTTLVEVLKEINTQTGYNVLWSTSKPEIYKKIDVKLENISIPEALDRVFEDQPFTYIIKDNNIVIKEAIPNLIHWKLPSINKELGVVTIMYIYGQIIDSEGRGIGGATVRLKGKNRSVITDRNGHFVFRGAEIGEVIVITCVGYLAKQVKAEAEMNKIVLIESNNQLEDIDLKAKKQIGSMVDLKNRSHMSLSQVLEGSIPGLTMKRSQESTTELRIQRNNESLTIREMWDKYIAGSNAQGPEYASFQAYESYVLSGLSNLTDPSTNTQASFRNVTTTMDNGIIPELRGASGFAGGTSGMLTVIDGFPQESFPANLPMSNIESVEVIKDPAECLKWGPKATGGVILITTKGPIAGKVEITYGSNFYFNPKRDVSASELQLASSADILDYYQEVYDKDLTNYLGGEVNKPRLRLKPGERIFYDLSKGLIDQSRFDFMRDSLSQISNRDQMRLLEQNALSQNHFLNIAGGIKKYRFSVSGNYATNRNNNLGSGSTNLGLNVQNFFNFFNNKLRARWLIAMNGSQNKSGINSGGTDLDPYELFIRPDGSYNYVFESILPEENQGYMDLGYHSYGINALEDLRLNKSKNNNFGMNSSLNLDWQLTDDLAWTTSIMYDRSRGKLGSLTNANSSQARLRFNQYSSPTLVGELADFYLPYGDFYNKSSSKRENYNVRTGFVYNHIWDKKHAVNANVGFGISSQNDRTVPDTTLYGYDRYKGIGLPVRTPASADFINNLGQTYNLSNLLTAGLLRETFNRNLALNGALTYVYDNRYALSADYSSMMSPSYGDEPPYSTTSNYTVGATWNIHKEHFFHVPWVSNLRLSATMGETQLAKLPSIQINANRILQPDFNNAYIIVNNYLISEYNGQKNRNINGKLFVGLSEDHLQFDLTYTKNSTGEQNQWNGALRYAIAQEPYFNIPFISTFNVELLLQKINAFGSTAMIMGNNSPDANGSFGMATNNSPGLLPPEINNKEAHLTVGFDNDRYLLDLRYYRKISSGVSNGTVPTDPATGLSSQANFSKIANEGVEMYLKTELIRNKNSRWAVTLNGAYNINKALEVPFVNFSASTSYLTAIRNGYATDNVWSYQWAGLDDKGNPTVFNSLGEKTATPDSTAIVYGGRLRAPWSGAFIMDYSYKNFFASARAIFNFGHVFRTYIPAVSTAVDRNVMIKDRWRQPGDEAFTDVAVLAPYDVTRTLLIQGSTNTILPADNIRLSEIQIGYDFPRQKLQNSVVKGLTISAQIQNLYRWNRNKLGVNPEGMTSSGVVIPQQPVSYGMSLNMNF